jgi:hypothetical protein
MINQELEDIRNNKTPQHFINIIFCIQRYYMGYSEFDEWESGEEWKKKSGILQHPIPDDLNEVVKECFIKQLEKFGK